MTLEDLQEVENKFLLLDTNVIIDSSKFPDEYQGFYDELKRKKVSAVLERTVQFEFLRGAQSKAQHEAFESHLQLLIGGDPVILQPDEETFKVARRISQIARSEEGRQLGLGDCLIGAQIKKYVESNGMLYLATQNHKDFPVCIFERKATYLITTHNGNIKVVGIYTFNLDYFNKICSELGL